MRSRRAMDHRVSSDMAQIIDAYGPAGQANDFDKAIHEGAAATPPLNQTNPCEGRGKLKPGGPRTCIDCMGCARILFPPSEPIPEPQAKQAA
jgi:hypothetical protein